MPRISFYVIGPPPKASNKILKPWDLMASVYWASQPSLVTITCWAPYDFNKSACSCFLTIFKRGMPSLIHLLLSILPKADAAAVWMIPFLWGFVSKMSVIPMTVNGFTIPEAADPCGTSSPIAKALKGMVVAYCPHVILWVFPHFLLRFIC